MEDSKVKQTKDSVKALAALVESLRGEGGCPWDQKQTPRSMLVYLLEEVYELADAIESNCAEAVREELGDVLFHIVFITRLFQEQDDFSIDDVAREITEKMIRRHPHVFGAERVHNTDQIRQNWHEIKQNEKKQDTTKSVIDSVPKKLPVLMRAYQIGERTARCGFNRQNLEDLIARLEAQFDQLKQAIANNNTDQISTEFGSHLFSLVNLARLLNFHPETALAGALKVFERRIMQMEKEDSGSDDCNY